MGQANSVGYDEHNLIYLTEGEKLTLDAMIQNNESINTMASILFHASQYHNVKNYIDQIRYERSSGNLVSSRCEVSAADLYSTFKRYRDTVCFYLDKKK